MIYSELFVPNATIGSEKKNRLKLLGDKLQLAESAGQVAGGASALGHAVQRISCSAQGSVHVSLIFKAELEATFANHGCFDIDKFPVVGGLSVTDRKLQHRGCKSFSFHFGITGAYGAEKFSAGLFEPYGVNGMVDNSHLVGFCVTDIDSCGVLVCTNFHILNVVIRV